ncbi:MAG: type 2 isopentenyl-diphosphate Delta-isomerase [Candidatus Micrarchaeaceae archaeon]
MNTDSISMQTAKRKLQHIEIVATKNTQYRNKTTLLECIEVLPRGGANNQKSVDLSTEFFGREVGAPLFVSGMTGGHSATLGINTNIAKAVSRLKIPMGVGSQRAMIEDKSLAYTYDVKKATGDSNIFLIGNIGASKLLEYSDKVIQSAADMIGADALAVHTNPGQESVQPEGDINFTGVYGRICELAKSMDKPVIVKEVGNGISKEVAMRLNGKVEAIDVQGAGGTTWIGIETYRSRSKEGLVFWDWGIPTALSVMEVLSAFKGTVLSSGGIRSGADVLKSIALGAQLAGFAQPVLMAERKGGSKGVYDYISGIEEELKREMALLGFSTIKELRKAKVAIKDPLRDVLKQRGVRLASNHA